MSRLSVWMLSSGTRSAPAGYRADNLRVGIGVIVHQLESSPCGSERAGSQRVAQPDHMDHRVAMGGSRV